MKSLIKFGLLAIVLALSGCAQPCQIGVVGFFSSEESKRQEKELRHYLRENNYREREKEPYVNSLFVIRVN